MAPSTSMASNLTQTPGIPRGSWEDFRPPNWGDGRHTAPSPRDVEVLTFDTDKSPRENPLCIVIDIPEEERKRATRLYNRMTRGELPATQDSSTPALLAQRQDQDTIIESLGPRRRFRVKGLVRSVRRVEPPDIDPSWVL